MLLGEYEHTIDDKNRLTLPAKLREELGEEVVLTRGLDGCLFLYSKAAFTVLAERVATLDTFNAGHMMYINFPDLKKQKADLARFIRSATAQQ